MITAVRGLLILGGVAMAVYGISLLWDVKTSDQVSLLIWLAGGLIVHDALLAPVYSMFGHAGKKLLPSTLWAPILVASAATLILLVLAFPTILPRPTAQVPQNTTILDRSYGLGLTVVLVVIWVLATVVAVRNHRSLRTASD